MVVLAIREAPKSLLTTGRMHMASNGLDASRLVRAVCLPRKPTRSPTPSSLRLPIQRHRYKDKDPLANGAGPYYPRRNRIHGRSSNFDEGHELLVSALAANRIEDALGYAVNV